MDSELYFLQHDDEEGCGPKKKDTLRSKCYFVLHRLNKDVRGNWMVHCLDQEIFKTFVAGEKLPCRPNYGKNTDYFSWEYCAKVWEMNNCIPLSSSSKGICASTRAPDSGIFRHFIQQY